MAYISPTQALSPKAYWVLLAVLHDGGPGGLSTAVGTWEGKLVLAQRYNGTDQLPVGFPNSRNYPSWFIQDEPLYGAIIKSLSDEEQKLARTLMASRAAA